MRRQHIVLPKSLAEMSDPRRLKDLAHGLKVVNALQRLKFVLNSGGNSSINTVEVNETGAIIRAAATLSGPSVTYDATAELGFSRNPTGVWSYGYMTVGFTNFTLFDTVATASYIRWRRSAVNEPCIILGNAFTAGFSLPAGMLGLHPGPSTEPAVLRWTAPVACNAARITGQFLSGDAGTTTVAVRRNTSVLFIATNAGVFDVLTEDIEAGDTIDFCVYGVYLNGTTPLVATITTNPDE